MTKVKPNTVQLREPIEASGKTWAELTMRSPKVKDLRNLTRNHPTAKEDEREVILFGWLTGSSVDVIEELELCDYTALQDIYGDFTETSKSPAA